MAKGSNREEVPQKTVDAAVKSVADKLNERLLPTIKGRGTFKSSHEIVGILNEEMLEVLMAVHQNNPEQLKRELRDVAVAAIFGLACLEHGKLDWL